MRRSENSAETGVFGVLMLAQFVSFWLFLATVEARFVTMTSYLR
ncbi:MAG: hypothetical protein ACRC46_04000 [Thermoguttaceae bacterium]